MKTQIIARTKMNKKLRSIGRSFKNFEMKLQFPKKMKIEKFGEKYENFRPIFLHQF